MSSIADQFFALQAEMRRIIPPPSELLPEEWPLPLSRKIGKDRLCHLPVYFDFDWEAIFGHTRKTFPNGRSLAFLTKRECPKGKYPALLLTVRTDVQQRPIHTSTHFIVVVKIDEYLRAANNSLDAATNYFAGATGFDVTSLTVLKEIASTSEGMDLLLSMLNVEKLKDWAGANHEAMMAMAEVVTTKGFAELLRVLSLEDAAKVLDWIVSEDAPDRVREIVQRVREDSLPSLYTLTGIARLKRALECWNGNLENDDEEFWQRELSANSFVLSQLFCQPVVIVKEKAYVGGKRLDNSHGNLVDFLCKNNLTRNFVLIEIKTPCTSLIGREYRGDVLNINSELSGAVLQATNYKYHLSEEWRRVTEGQNEPQYAFDPPCVVIIGNSSELDSMDKIKAFEHFRTGLKHIEVITFSEMYSKLKTLLHLLEGESFARREIDSVDPLAGIGL